MKGYLLAYTVIASPRESACKLSYRSGCSSVCLRGCLVRGNQSRDNDLRCVGLDPQLSDQKQADQQLNLNAEVHQDRVDF